jgi:outer membrane protein assembly factor BamB
MTDFISGLRSDLLDAAAREQQRGPLGRAARPLRPRAWGRGAVPGVVAVAAAVALFVLAVIALAPNPARRPARPRVAAVIPLGGTPDGAAFGAGALWVADFDGALLRVDPAQRRVVRRFRLGAEPDSIAAVRDGVWVRVVGTDHGAGSVLRVDPATGRVLARVKVGSGSGVAVGARSVWVPRRFFGPEGVDRIDRARAVRTGRIGVRNVDGSVEAGGVLWVAVHDGSIVAVDARTGRVMHRWTALAPSDAAAVGAETLVADARGLWVLSSVRGRIFRLAGDRVVRRIPVDATAQPMLARTSGGLWIATGSPSVTATQHNRLVRIDGATGRATATVDIGEQHPVALVGAGRDLFVVTSQGRVLVVRG